MNTRQKNMLFFLILSIILVIATTSHLILKEPTYSGPELEVKYNWNVVVACQNSKARLDLGNVIGTEENLPKLCIEKCELSGFSYGIKYEPYASNSTLCLCEGQSKDC